MSIIGVSITSDGYTVRAVVSAGEQTGLMLIEIKGSLAPHSSFIDQACIAAQKYLSAHNDSQPR